MIHFSISNRGVFMSSTTEAAPAVSAATYPYFTEEHDLFRQTVKQFVQTEVAPHAEEWDEAGIFPKELFKKAADLGLFGIRLDPSTAAADWIGGTRPLTLRASRIRTVAGHRWLCLFNPDITLPVLDELGTDEQKEEFLRPAIAGDRIAALGISEPGGGSDVAALTTQAQRRRRSADFRTEALITNGARADFLILAVRTGEDRYKGVSMVLFPTDTKGFAVGKKLKKVGNLCSDTAELFFDNCRIPKRYVLGELGRGSTTRCTTFKANDWPRRSPTSRLWSAQSNMRLLTARIEWLWQTDRRLSGVEAPVCRAQDQHRSREVAHLSRSRLDQSRRARGSRDNDGQAVHKRDLTKGRVRLYADLRRVWLHDRVSDQPILERCTFEYNRRGRF
jgi:hypothetical protein